MAADLPDLVVRVADDGDVGALASLRSLWAGGTGDDPQLERRIAAWLDAEGDRRTTWLATLGASPVGMASLFEYRRMPRPDRPDPRWGYVGNVFVREELRNRGIGTALLRAVIGAADDRRYERLVLSPSARAVPLVRRAGFVAPGVTPGETRLLVRPGPPP